MGTGRLLPIPNLEDRDKMGPARANQRNDAPGEQGLEGGHGFPTHPSVCLSALLPAWAAKMLIIVIITALSFSFDMKTNQHCLQKVLI